MLKILKEAHDAVEAAKQDEAEAQGTLAAVVDRLDALRAEEAGIVESGENLDRLDGIVAERESLERERRTAERRLEARRNVVAARERDVHAAKLADCEAQAERIRRKHERTLAEVREAMGTVDAKLPELEAQRHAFDTARRVARLSAERSGEPRPSIAGLEEFGRAGRTERDLGEFVRAHREAWGGNDG